MAFSVLKAGQSGWESGCVLWNTVSPEGSAARWGTGAWCLWGSHRPLWEMGNLAVGSLVRTKLGLPLKCQPPPRAVCNSRKTRCQQDLGEAAGGQSPVGITASQHQRCWCSCCMPRACGFWGAGVVSCSPEDRHLSWAMQCPLCSPCMQILGSCSPEDKHLSWAMQRPLCSPCMGILGSCSPEDRHLSWAMQRPLCSPCMQIQGSCFVQSAAVTSLPLEGSPKAGSV